MIRTKRNRKGSTIIMALVLMGLLAALSTTILKGIMQERARQTWQLNQMQRIQTENDMVNETVQEKFANVTVPMTARIAGHRGSNTSREYSITITPTARPVSESATNESAVSESAVSESRTISVDFPISE